MTRLWIHELGWLSLEDGSSGLWQDNRWTELAELIAAVPSRQDVQVILAPDLFVYLNELVRPGQTPMDIAGRRLGLRPGKWSFQTHVVDERIHIVCFPTETTLALEQLAAARPGNLTLSFAPLLVPDRADQELVIRLDQRHIFAAFDDQGALQQWHWIPENMISARGARGVSPDTLFESDAITWLDYLGDPVIHYRALAVLNKRLAMALVACVLLAAGVLGARQYVERDYQNRYNSAAVFIEQNRLDAQEVAQLQQSGEVISQELQEIQEFSNRDAPLANHMVALANQIEGQVRWREFAYDKNGFVLVVGADRSSEILDQVSKIRTLPDVTDLQLEDVDARARGGGLQGRIEGRFQ